MYDIRMIYKILFKNHVMTKSMYLEIIDLKCNAIKLMKKLKKITIRKKKLSLFYETISAYCFYTKIIFE